MGRWGRRGGCEWRCGCVMSVELEFASGVAMGGRVVGGERRGERVCEVGSLLEQRLAHHAERGWWEWKGIG